MPPRAIRGPIRYRPSSTRPVMGSPAVSATPSGACRSERRSGVTATLLWPDGEGSGGSIVRTRASCGALRRARRGARVGWDTDSMDNRLADADLATLVPEWLDWAGAAELLG